MKKLFALSLCSIALVACKTEVEKDVSLKTLLSEPVKTEIALLNIQISGCSSHEDSRKESDALIKIKSKIPTVFQKATFKECYSKNFDSFASFEIPVGVGAIQDNTDPNFENDINIYSYGNRKLNVSTSKSLSESIRNFLKSEYVSKFDFNISLNITNDTDTDHNFSILSSYIDNDPVPLYPNFTFKKGQKINLRLANTSADALWRYGNDMHATALAVPFNLNELPNPNSK